MASDGALIIPSRLEAEIIKLFAQFRPYHRHGNAAMKPCSIQKYRSSAKAFLETLLGTADARFSHDANRAMISVLFRVPYSVLGEFFPCSLLLSTIYDKT